MKVEDTISTLQRLREKNGDGWKTVVEKGKEKERNEESLPIRGYLKDSSIKTQRRWLDEKRGKWIVRSMELITEEMKEMFQVKIVEYRVNKQAAEKKPPTKSPEEIEKMLFFPQYNMELLLLYEVKEWEQLSGTNSKLFWTRSVMINWKKEKD